jgi:glyoxylase I family protein
LDHRQLGVRESYLRHPLQANTDELDKWHYKLTEMGIEHSEIVESPYGHHLNFKDPDGIALELFVPASQQ